MDRRTRVKYSCTGAVINSAHSEDPSVGTTPGGSGARFRRPSHEDFGSAADDSGARSRRPSHEEPGRRPALPRCSRPPRLSTSLPMPSASGSPLCLSCYMPCLSCYMPASPVTCLPLLSHALPLGTALWNKPCSLAGCTGVHSQPPSAAVVSSQEPLRASSRPCEPPQLCSR